MIVSPSLELVWLDMTGWPTRNHWTLPWLWQLSQTPTTDLVWKSCTSCTKLRVCVCVCVCVCAHVWVSVCVYLCVCACACLCVWSLVCVVGVIFCVPWYSIWILWGFFMLSWMFQHDHLDTYCFECLICMCFIFLYLHLFSAIEHVSHAKAL